MNEELFGYDADIFTALGITEEWEDEEKEQYTDEDARILKEYGFWLGLYLHTVSSRFSCPRWSFTLAWTKYSYHPCGWRQRIGVTWTIE